MALCNDSGRKSVCVRFLVFKRQNDVEVGRVGATPASDRPEIFGDAQAHSWGAVFAAGVSLCFGRFCCCCYILYVVCRRWSLSSLWLVFYPSDGIRVTPHSGWCSPRHIFDSILMWGRLAFTFWAVEMATSVGCCCRGQGLRDHLSRWKRALYTVSELILCIFLSLSLCYRCVSVPPLVGTYNMEASLHILHQVSVVCTLRYVYYILKRSCRV